MWCAVCVRASTYVSGALQRTANDARHRLCLQCHARALCLLQTHCIQQRVQLALHNALHILVRLAMAHQQDACHTVDRRLRHALTQELRPAASPQWSSSAASRRSMATLSRSCCSSRSCAWRRATARHMRDASCFSSLCARWSVYVRCANVDRLCAASFGGPRGATARRATRVSDNARETAHVSAHECTWLG